MMADFRKWYMFGNEHNCVHFRDHHANSKEKNMIDPRIVR